MHVPLKIQDLETAFSGISTLSKPVDYATHVSVAVIERCHIGTQMCTLNVPLDVPYLPFISFVFLSGRGLVTLALDEGWEWGTPFEGVGAGSRVT